MNILNLTNELIRHRDEQLKAIKNTILEWGLLYGGELQGLLSNVGESLKKLNAESHEDITEEKFEEEFDQLLIEAHSLQKNKTCPCPTNLTVKEIEHYMLPLQGKEHYQRFLAMVQLQNSESFAFPEDLFFLCGSHRFYYNLHNQDIKKLEEYLPFILKIDREIANIRVAVSLSLGTQKHRRAEAWRIMSRKTKYRADEIKWKKKLSTEIMFEAYHEPNAEKSFSQFTTALAGKLGTTAKAVKEELASMGYGKGNFEELKDLIQKHKISVVSGQKTTAGR